MLNGPRILSACAAAVAEQRTARRATSPSMIGPAVFEAGLSAGMGGRKLWVP